MALSAPLASNHPCCISSTSYATPAWPAPKLLDSTGGWTHQERQDRQTDSEIKETERDQETRDRDNNTEKKRSTGRKRDKGKERTDRHRKRCRYRHKKEIHTTRTQME